MRYHLLGTSDLLVSEISYGCMSLSQDQQANEQLLHRACDLGINLFDTADIYDKGLNEISVGKALKDRRKDVLIASKAGNQLRPDGSGLDWNPSKAHILEAVEASLRRLQTDYLDLYQLHGGTIDDPIDETIEAFELLKAQGKIRWYGISSIRPNVIREYVKRSQIVSNMMQYSLLDRRPEEAMLDLLAKNHISVIVRGAVAKGLLAGKPPREYQEHSAQSVMQITTALGAHTSDRLSLGQAALRYSLSHPAVATVAAGASSLAQLEENAAVADLPPLSQEERQALQALSPAGLYAQHR
jgi:aryl-alcohol dehydrogenase-like predicted oxidoreductase